MSAVFKCANNESKLEGNCARGYTGWLCSTCAKGYFSVFGFCRSCPKSIWALLAEVVAIIVVIGCFVGFVAYTYSREVNDGRRSIVDVVLARGKIVIGFYQVMGEFWESLNGVYWQTIFKTLSQWLDILQLNVSNVVIKPSCFFPNFRLTPYVEFIIGVSTPVIILALSITILLAKRIYLLLKNRKGRSNIEESETTHTRDKVFLLSLLALYITYPSTCNSIFALYRPVCQTFYLDENKEMTVALLRPEFSINCSTEVHRRYEISAYVMSSYVVAFPGVLLYLLWKFSEGKLYPIMQLLVVSIRTQNGSGFCLRTTKLASLWAIFLNMLVAAVPVPDNMESSLTGSVMTVLLVIGNSCVICIVSESPC
ncbi:hypothetical protein BSL78_22843 [Apostichopus japonicus]|uniref:Uncharacterized protein n=1 Tax=Stichopus japonicus TaxID=307972 RepID=A0A2G8JXA4_STIJA|nr:hypothetical protein BSL78_22843 [Apostichopus japonicus]